MALSAVLLQKGKSFFQELQQKSQRRISFAQLSSHGHVRTNHWGTGHKTLWLASLGHNAQSWISGNGVSQIIRSPKAFTGVGSCSLLQGIFPTQGFNPGLPHCRGILYQLSHQGSPRILEWAAYPFSRGSSRPRNQTGVSCIAGKFFTSWATREALKQCWAVKKLYMCLGRQSTKKCYVVLPEDISSMELWSRHLRLDIVKFSLFSFFFLFVAPGHMGY